MAASARTTIRTANDLVGVVSGSPPNTIREFITRTIHDTVIAKEWRGVLGHLILSGVQIDSEIMIPQLVNLAADDHSTFEENLSQSSQPSNQYDVDRSRMTWLFQDQLDDALTVLTEYEGEDIHSIRARESARIWQSERSP